MYQKRISLLFILAFSLSILISCGGDPGTNIKSGKVHTGYYSSGSVYNPMEYRRSDIVATNDNYTISFKLPQDEAFSHTYEVPMRRNIGTDGYTRFKGEDSVPMKTINLYTILELQAEEGYNKVDRSYRKRMRFHDEEPYIIIERKDIKTEKFKNSKYYLYITINGVEQAMGLDEYQIYEITTNEYGSMIDKKKVEIVYRNHENINVVFTVMMRDGAKDELRPIHVENYWVFNDFILKKGRDMAEIIKTQVYKFMDEIDYGYRGKLPPKPIDEDEEY